MCVYLWIIVDAQVWMTGYWHVGLSECVVNFQYNIVD